MHIRPAAAEDAPAIAEVHVLSWQESYAGRIPQEYLEGQSIEDETHKWRRRLVDDPDPAQAVFVLVDGDEVVGFTSTRKSPDPDAGDGVGEVEAMYVRARFWDQGWGRELLYVSLDQLRRDGFSETTCWIFDANIRTRRAAEKLGWRRDGATRLGVLGGQAATKVRYRRSLEH